MPVQAMPPAVLVELVNGWGNVPRAEAGQQAEPYPPLTDLIDRFGLPEHVAAAITDAELRRVADLLHPIFAATDIGERAIRTTDLLTRSGLRPALLAVGSSIESSWSVEDPETAVLAAAASALYGQLTGHPPDRLGTCAGDRCADAYIDASPAGHRRFCSITCQNRARVAAFRRRRAAST